MPRNNSGFERIAHRGASREAPENTIPAIRLAVEKYLVDRVEIDLRLTRDGIPVVFHDETLERTTNGQGPVSAHSLAQLKTLDAGYHFDPEGKGGFPFRGRGVFISTLEDVLKEFPGTRFCLEIKDKELGGVEKVLKVIQAARGRNVPQLIGSFDGKISRELLNHPLTSPSSLEGIFLSEPEVIRLYFGFRLRFGKRRRGPYARFASLPRKKHGIRLDDPGWIDFLHRQGIKVFFWTINDPVEMRALIESGADGIVSDSLNLF